MLPVDADLEALDAELTAAGAHARRMLYGRSQPTRVFTNQLRARLLGRLEPQTAPSGASEPMRPPAGEREMRPPAQMPLSGDPPAGGASDRAATTLASPVSLRAVLALLTIVGMAAVLALGAFSGSFGPPLP